MKKKNVINYLIPSLLIILIINIICCLIDYNFDFSRQIFSDIADKNSFVTDLFLAEVQITFIVLSLATVLTTQTKQVYWVDIFQYRLIKPKFWNFTALTSYILATFIDGVIIMTADKCMGGFYCTMGLISSFLISLFLMSVLSVRMIGANFGREELKKELEEELKTSLLSIRKVNKHIGFDNGPRLPQIRQLVQVTMQELEEKKLDLACENMDLLCRYKLNHTLKRCYNYAIDSSSSQVIMDEVNYSLMNNALKNSNTEFFTALYCPIPFKSQAALWDDIIYDEFDKAAVLFRDGCKDEAYSVRLKLYNALLMSFYTALSDLESGSTNRADEEIRYRVIMLIGTFVSRRTQHVPFIINNEDIHLDKDWEIKESEMEGYDADNDVYKDYIVDQINEALGRWVDIDDDFLCDSFYLDWEYLSLTRDF